MSSASGKCSLLLVLGQLIPIYSYAEEIDLFAKSLEYL